MSLPQHKPYIDGLRAFAVIVVLLFHMNPSLFSGGYLGVDIFFVISGFVISQSLYKSYIKNGKISIVNFYVRRFKRLFPALLTMIIGTTVAYIFIGFLWDTNLYLKSAVSAILAVSNLYFLFRGDVYFHQDLINPLNHTWSLGLEEQFYLIYPIFLAISLWWVRRYKLSITTLSVLFFGLSLILYVSFVLNSETLIGDFFFPFARFWELGIGCALFFVTQRYSFKLYQSLIIWISAVGLVALQFIRPLIDVIQIETLIAVLLTGLLIVAGLSNRGKIIELLEHKITTYIGRLSYSLYLWHLPVIYFMNLYTVEIIYYIFAPIISFLLASLSYHFVEKPIRYSVRFDRALKKGVYMIPYALVIGIILVLIIGQGNVRASINDSFNKVAETIPSVNKIESSFNLGQRIQPNYLINETSILNCTKQFAEFTEDLNIIPECLDQKNNEKFFYLTGDSHALHLVSLFDSAKTVNNFYFTEIPRQSIVNENPKLFDIEKSIRVLNQQNRELAYFTNEFEEVYYILSFFLSPWQDQIEVIESNLRKTIESTPPDVNIIFVAPTPVFPAGPESCVLLGKHCEIDRDRDDERRSSILSMYRVFEKEYDNVHIYDLNDEICTQKSCQNYDAEKDFLIYMDQDHLSVEQSVKLSQHFDSWFKQVFDQR